VITFSVLSEADLGLPGDRPLDDAEFVPETVSKSGKALLPTPPQEEETSLAERLETIQQGGAALLAKGLTLLAALAWLGLCLLFGGAFIGFGLAELLWATLPFRLELLALLPLLITLGALAAAARTVHSARGLMLRSTYLRAFVGLLIPVLLSLLPGVGLFLGIYLGARLLIREPLTGKTVLTNTEPAVICRRFDLTRLDVVLGMLLLSIAFYWQLALTIWLLPMVTR
jgi:hypothetical protein